MPDARVIGIVGAESTGKTALAQALAQTLAARGQRATWVTETLRDWCDAQGRTPRIDEQRGIAERHTARIAEAAATHDVVVADTTALMTAVYSHTVFGDDRLDAWAAQLHARCDVTLVTALDLPWVADGLQRDGPQVRVPVDDRLRLLLARHRIGWSLVSGQGPRRLQAALAACTAPASPAQAGAGMFTRLSAAAVGPTAWRCAECDDPACERHLAHQRTG